MRAITLCLLFVGISLVFSQGQNPPELKLAFDYRILNTLKTSVIKPMVEDKLKDITLNSTYSGKKGPFTGEILNISLSNITLDWDNSYLLAPNKDNVPTFILYNTSLLLTFEMGAHYYIFNYSQLNNTVAINGLDIEIGLGFSNLSNETSFAYIDYVNVSLQTCALQFNNTYMQIVLLLGQIFGIKIPQYAGNFLKETIIGLNQTVIDTTLTGLQFELFDLFGVGITLADLPFVFNMGDRPSQAFSFNLETVNVLTNQSAPVAPADFMPNYYENGLPVQVFISENAISQALWAFFQSGVLKKTLSNADLPSVVPLQLSTSSLTVFFPSMKTYGYDKGIYLQTDKGGDYPIVFIRDGRLVATVALMLEFWVDTDSSQYPSQGLANCTTCEKAVALNVSAMADMFFYEQNVTHLGVQIMDTVVTNVKCLAGDVNVTNFEHTVNDIFIGLLIQANTVLDDGILNPFIGHYSVNETTLSIGTDYLQMGLSFDK